MGGLGDGEMGVPRVVRLPYAPSSVAEARKRHSSDLHDCGVFHHAIDDAVLVVIELLSNALRHAHPLPSGMVRVSWLRSGEHIEVSASVVGSAPEPNPRRTATPSPVRPRPGCAEYSRWYMGPGP